MTPTEKFVLAIDQGTTSTRAIIFNHSGEIVSVGQKEFTQIFPNPGWVEHNPIEIWDTTRTVVAEALQKAEINRHNLAAVGITNQRETTVVWDKNTGEPVYNAIVWQDMRTSDIVKELEGDEGPDRFRQICGLGLSPYFSGSKIKWILDNVEGARERAEAGDLLFGNTDCWVLWNLTGGVNGGVHCTDVTNASRTMLMDIRTLQWREDVCEIFGIPMSMLPEIKSSSEIYGYGRKNGLLIDTPTEPVFSDNGLLTTVAYKIGDQPAVYALEGSIAVAGSLVQWLRDNLGMIVKSSDIGELASTVEDNGGVYFVPAFSGLFAPYWRSDARGAIVGLTRYVNKGHIARAVEESTAFQSAEVLDAMNADSGVPLKELKVDGGMTHDDLVMQFQADLCGVDVVRPKVIETTALGAAYAAGMAVGYWESTDDVVANWQEGKRWTPTMEPAERDRTYRLWKKAVTRTLDWVDEDVK